VPGNTTGRHYPEITELLSRNLRLAREQASLSQETVAKQTGIPRTALSDIENGNRGVSAVELWALAGLYTVSIDSLLDAPPLLKPVGGMTIADVLDSVASLMAHAVRNWGQHARDAWLYGVFVGWACEDDHEHNWICGGNEALTEVAERHGWTARDVAELQQQRAVIRSLTTPTNMFTRTDHATD